MSHRLHQEKIFKRKESSLFYLKAGVFALPNDDSFEPTKDDERKQKKQMKEENQCLLNESDEQNSEKMEVFPHFTDFKDG